ncbi:hypothetical protein TNCV_2762101 [Trichonephila clavipes]|nr:hypothetical protein TNCV_2762101 [Trichonephila clavipes]
MNFLQLNINDAQRKIDELSSTIHTQNIHVDTLQKTKLNSELNLKVKGYRDIRKDRPNSSGGCIAFFVKTPDIEQIHERDDIDKFLRNHSEQLRCKLINVSHRAEEDISTWKLEEGAELCDKERLCSDFPGYIQKAAKHRIPEESTETTGFHFVKSTIWKNSSTTEKASIRSS